MAALRIMSTLAVRGAMDRLAGSSSPSLGGATFDFAPTAVLRTLPARDGSWPYAQRLPDARGDEVRATLRPYFRWGAAGPAAMRVWIPEAR